METILLSKSENAIINIACDFFNLFNLIPQEIRGDSKKRTGIHFFITEPGTRNFISNSVGRPSEAARIFAIEKATRMGLLGDYSSQNSENIELMRFRGALTVEIEGIKIQASVSGLQSDEDAFTAVKILAYIFNISDAKVCKIVKKHGGILPESFNKKNHYLYIDLGEN